MTVSLDEVRAAAERIAGRVRRTPVIEVAPGLTFKLELLQHTGSFKPRGAFNRLLTAKESGELSGQGIVAASGGNAGLAAAYAFGIARNHPFVDGNKRTAWMLARLFLAANGVSIQFDKQEATHTVQALAASELSEDELARWLRERIQTS